MNSIIVKNYKLSITFMLLISLVLVGCTNSDDSTRVEDNLFIGTWQLVETNGLSGPPIDWSTVDNGYVFTFTREGTFTTNKFSECTTGSYTFTNMQLTLSFGCEGFTTGIEDPEGVFIENYTFEDGNLFLTPTYLSCAEGCVYKFESQ